MSKDGFRPRRPWRGSGIGGYPLPPALARLPSSSDRLPREFLEQGQRDRILLAALEVFGTKGLAAATVQDLIAEASTSRETFYRSFTGREDCFAALHDELLDWLSEQAREAARQGEDWAGAVVEVGERLVGLLVEDSRIARVCAVDYLLAGPEVIARQDAAIAALAAALRAGRAEVERDHDLPDALEVLLISGATAMVSRSLLRGSPRSSARTLAREVLELVLIFYVGEGRARRILEG